MAAGTMASPDRPDLNEQAEGRPAGDLGGDAATEMQALFLSRLRILLEKRHGGASAALPAEQRLILDRAIYSTFCDCLELGLTKPARALLRELPAS
jgi:hypothetical protein